MITRNQAILDKIQATQRVYDLEQAIREAMIHVGVNDDRAMSILTNAVKGNKS